MKEPTGERRAPRCKPTFVDPYRDHLRAGRAGPVRQGRPTSGPWKSAPRHACRGAALSGPARPGRTNAVSPALAHATAAVNDRGPALLTTWGVMVSGLPASCDSASCVVVGRRRSASPTSSALDSLELELARDNDGLPVDLDRHLRDQAVKV